MKWPTLLEDHPLHTLDLKRNSGNITFFTKLWPSLFLMWFILIMLIQRQENTDSLSSTRKCYHTRDQNNWRQHAQHPSLGTEGGYFPRFSVDILNTWLRDVPNGRPHQKKLENKILNWNKVGKSSKLEKKLMVKMNFRGLISHFVSRYFVKCVVLTRAS